MLDKVIACIDKIKFIYTIGNGGSASTCSHFANDLTRHGYKAISLTDVAVITRIGNDFGYEEIFVNQLKVLFGKGDILVAISASGNSPNLLKAVDYANTLGTTVAIVGFDGGKLLKLCNLVIHTITDIGEYEDAENKHLEVCHMITRTLGSKV